MDHDFCIQLTTMYKKNSERKIFPTRFFLPDSSGSTHEVLQLISVETEPYALSFNSLGLINRDIPKLDPHRHSILTGILNIKDSDSINFLFEHYGADTEDQTAVYKIQDLKTTFETLKTIILLKNEMKKSKVDEGTVLRLYISLVKHGCIQTHKYPIGSMLPTDNDEKKISFNSWGRSMLYCSSKTIDSIAEIIKSYKDAMDPDDSYTFHFTDSITDDKIESNIDLFNCYDYTHGDMSAVEIIEIFYNVVTNFCSDQYDIDTICLYHYLYGRAISSRDINSLDDITEKDLDSTAAMRLTSIADALCDAYLEEMLKSSKIDIRYIDGRLVLIVGDLLSAAIVSLIGLDFKKYTFSKCKKPGCGRYFIRPVGKTKNCFCCSEHAKSEAQRTYRKKKFTEI